MKWLLLAFGLSLAVVALGADRFIVEDGKADGGTFTPSTLATHVFGQGTASTDGKNGTILENANCSSNTCTRDLPFSDKEGIHLGDVDSCITTACVDAGTFVDGGTLEFLVRNPYALTDAGLAWSAMPELEMVAPNNSTCFSTGVRRNSFREKGWRMLPRANGLKVSTSAPTLTIQTHCCLRQGVGGCGEP